MAASRNAELHHERAVGLKTEVLFMGWESATVHKAANEHVAREKTAQDISP